MSEMVRRVKAAILLAEGHQEWDELAPHWEETYTAMARAAIEAMREPTEAMDRAGAIYSDCNAATRVWQVMIDEALK